MKQKNKLFYLDSSCETFWVIELGEFRSNQNYFAK